MHTRMRMHCTIQLARVSCMKIPIYIIDWHTCDARARRLLLICQQRRPIIDWAFEALPATVLSVAVLDHFLPEVFWIIVPEQSRHRHRLFFLELVGDGVIHIRNIPHDGSLNLVDHDVNDPIAAVQRKAAVLKQTLQKLYIYIYIYYTLTAKGP